MNPSLSLEEETVTEMINVREASPVLKTTVATSGPGQILHGTAAPTNKKSCIEMLDARELVLILIAINNQFHLSLRPDSRVSTSVRRNSG